MTEQQKDFLFRAMIAELGVTLYKNPKNGRHFFVKKLGLFGGQMIIGEYFTDNDYEMYGYPETNYSICKLLNEHYNTKVNIVFKSDKPAPFYDFYLY